MYYELVKCIFQSELLAAPSAKQPLLCLEPEAASICCRSIYAQEYGKDDWDLFPVGTRYLVLDCGGK